MSIGALFALKFVNKILLDLIFSVWQYQVNNHWHIKSRLVTCLLMSHWPLAKAYHVAKSRVTVEGEYIRECTIRKWEVFKIFFP